MALGSEDKPTLKLCDLYTSRLWEVAREWLC